MKGAFLGEDAFYRPGEDLPVHDFTFIAFRLQIHAVMFGVFH